MVMGGLKERFRLNNEKGKVRFMESLPDEKTSVDIAVCLRLAMSEKAIFRDDEFVEEMKRYFRESPMGNQFVFEVAYYMFSSVFDLDLSWGNTRVSEAKPTDQHGIGELSAEDKGFFVDAIVKRIKAGGLSDGDYVKISYLLERANTDLETSLTGIAQTYLDSEDLAKIDAVMTDNDRQRVRRVQADSFERLSQAFKNRQ